MNIPNPQKLSVTLLTAALSVFAALVPHDTHAGVAVNGAVGFSIGGGAGVVDVGYRRGYRTHVGPGPHGYYPRYGVGPRYVHPRWTIGLWVPFLPIGYATYWWGGAPYFYYDDTYFVTDGRGYRVVKKPTDGHGFSPASDPGPAPVVAAPPKNDGAPVPSFEQSARTGQLFAYPRNGQSETTATFDRIECESWGSKQTGFNPTVTPVDEAKKAEYTRAVSACLEGRGYSVK